MNPVDLIRTKRDGGIIGADDMREFINGVARGTVEDAQLGAFLMAVYMRGLNEREQADMTLAMRDSGEVLEWPDLPGPVLDKHSTGGVGDLVSLVLAPLVASCGAFVPMISGRGLGHTGGTLDKLESIPGFNVNLPGEQVRRCVREAGFVMIGQGAGLAPADRRMYATRDVTATVSCRPLIVASILSKKLAEGLDGLVMDIKTGNGAIMPHEHEAASLGQAIVDVAAAAGLPATALITDKNQPLATSAGNALEVAEAIRFLRGERHNTRLAEVIFALGREMLAIGKLELDTDKAQARLEQALDSGEAAERFARLVAMQGGPSDLLDHPGRYLHEAPEQVVVAAPASGYVVNMQTRALGRLVGALGGGRMRADDPIDPAVGLSGFASLGQRLEAGEPMAVVHAANAADAERGVQAVRDAIELADQPPAHLPPTIHRRLTSG